MKIGILVTIVVTAIALYFVFASDMLSPAATVVAPSKEASLGTTVEASKQSTLDSRSGGGERGAPESDKRPLGAGTVPSQDALDEGVAAAPGANVTRTPGTPIKYTRHDGVVIRDHRIDAPKPDLHAYTVIPPEASKVKAVTLIEVRKELQSSIRQCITANSAGAADDGELQLLLLTSISAETLTVDKASIKITGLASDGDLHRCLEQAVVGHQQTAVGAEDVNLHRMVFKFGLQ